MSTAETITQPPATAASAGARVHPPVLVTGYLLAGLFLQRLLPFSVLPRGFSTFVGRLMAVAGLGLAVASARTMGEAGTPLQPDRPSTALVTTGPYRFTRNPIYASMVLLYSGIALFANAVWPLLLLPSVVFVLTKGMIEKEEAYLQQRFGDAYRRYKEHVRRWI